MQQVDIQAVKAAMEEFRISQRKLADDPEQGCVFRAQLAVTPELTLWRAEEVNRGTDPNEVLNAMVMLVASTIAGEIMAVTDDQGAQFETFNRTIHAIAEEVAALFLDPTRGIQQRFPMEEVAGNA